MTARHHIVAPAGLAPAVGFSHAVAAAAGRTVHVAGQVAVDAAGVLVGEDFVAQFDVALGNVVAVVRAAGGNPADIVAMTVFTTDVASYREARARLGAEWRRHMGLHYPAMALVGVTELVEPEALVEITAVAVVPDPPGSER